MVDPTAPKDAARPRASTERGTTLCDFNHHDLANLVNGFSKWPGEAASRQATTAIGSEVCRRAARGETGFSDFNHQDLVNLANGFSKWQNGRIVARRQSQSRRRSAGASSRRHGNRAKTINMSRRHSAKQLSVHGPAAVHLWLLAVARARCLPALCSPSKDRAGNVAIPTPDRSGRSDSSHNLSGNRSPIREWLSWSTTISTPVASNENQLGYGRP